MENKIFKLLYAITSILFIIFIFINYISIDYIVDMSLERNALYYIFQFIIVIIIYLIVYLILRLLLIKKDLNNIIKVLLIILLIGIIIYCVISCLDISIKYLSLFIIKSLSYLISFYTLDNLFFIKNKFKVRSSNLLALIILWLFIIICFICIINYVKIIPNSFDNQFIYYYPYMYCVYILVNIYALLSIREKKIK